MSWVYVRSEPQLWTVGFYRPDGRWEPDSDHGSSAEAADRVRFLNGKCLCTIPAASSVETGERPS